MIRRMKHALRWLGLGAALAYLFDPERGHGRREAVRTRGIQLIDRAKESMAQLRGDADDVIAHVEAPTPTPAGDARSSTPVKSGTAAAV